MKNLTKEQIIKFIEDDLEDFGIQKDERAYSILYENAIEAAEIMEKKELQKYIEDYINSLPLSYFNQCC